jgi:pimeloyl-ACP methyl ester carboxylesterase
MQRHRARVVRAMLPAVAAIGVLAPGAAADTGAVPATPALGLQTQLQFHAYSPLSASAEIVRRLLSPLDAAEVQRSLASSSERLSEQSIDLETERFVLYVPAHAPADGYALLAFVPPWDEAQLPHGWAPVLDRYGAIFVSAAHSGNSADVIGRREPLALLAAWNVMQRYRVDPQRVYVGGFSGGSRIALRLGLAYPDLFRGALLNAGSDPLDAGPPSPPARELLARFQQSTRIVFVTGEHDALHLSMDRASLESMREWCVFDTAAEITPGAGHELASPAALSQALGALQSHVRADAARLAGCRDALDRRLATQLLRVRSLIDAGKSHEARSLLEETDRRFGGLAAPQTVALAAALE